MSCTNTNFQTQTSNGLHNAIMEVGGKDCPPMLAPGGLETTTEGYMENYKNVSHDIRNQLDAEAEALQIILTGIDNDIYSTSQELKTVSHHKLYDILKQHQNEVNEIRPERLTRTANPLALVAQQQPAYHPQNHPNHYTHNSTTRSQQAVSRNIGKTIVNSCTPIYDHEPALVTVEDEMSKEKEIDKIMAFISLSFKKIYKPTNNNLRTSSNTSRANQDNTLRINKNIGHDNQRVVNVVGAKENVDAANNSRPIFDTEPLQKVKNDDDNYNVFANDKEHPQEPESVNDTYLDEQDLKKFQDEVDRYHDVNYALKVEIDCAKAKGDLMSYKVES
nr:hypothetical protein [Tanacetum cinerariifolium]